MAAADAPIRKRDRLKARARRYMTVPLAVRTADLPKRLASAGVMLAVAGTAVALGGVVLRAFIALVALACFVEFVLLVGRATQDTFFRVAAILAGMAYIGLAAVSLALLPSLFIIVVVGTVIFVDSFAYFVGRAIGGPKIAPRISPSKTWAGLLGGIIGANLWIGLLFLPLSGTGAGIFEMPTDAAEWSPFVGMGVLAAIAAQAGDFFESWLKRRAGKKDSSNLIPGHGGVFDRVDGILPVAILGGWLLGNWARW